MEDHVAMDNLFLDWKLTILNETLPGAVDLTSTVFNYRQLCPSLKILSAPRFGTQINNLPPLLERLKMVPWTGPGWHNAQRTQKHVLKINKFGTIFSSKV